MLGGRAGFSSSARAWKPAQTTTAAANTPVRGSLEIFDAVGTGPLREKSMRLTRYLEQLLGASGADHVTVITPSEPAQRGCQLSLLVADRPQELSAALHAADIVSDFRPPNVVRVAPVPLYNTFHDVWRFAQALTKTPH